MPNLRRTTAAAVAAAGLLSVAGIGPASATTNSAFDANSGVSRVTGTIYWTAANKFELLDVTLSDTSCDGRSARFVVRLTNRANAGGALVNGKGCGTSVSYDDLHFTNTTKSVVIVTQACNAWGCSSTGQSALFDDPYN